MAKRWKKTTVAQRRRALVRCAFTCQQCGWVPKIIPDDPGRYSPYDEFLGDHLEVDHRHPVALGGGNEDSNLQALCTTCNRRKGARV